MREESIPAAIYARMSTDHQQYSIDNQRDVILEYADKHNMQIVREYNDEGRSGLNIEGRDALRRLISDVESGSAEYSVVLVYDVSRWGRFQDADESAYYEYICKKAGVTVIYCAEMFQNDGSPTSTIIKSIKRTMAGEKSRELSAKVFQGQCRLIELGYRQGGTAGYGLRRMLVDAQGNEKGILGFGEHKSIQTDRVILVPGPEEEVETVRRMYRLFVLEEKTEGQIAKILNREGLRTDWDREWTDQTVREVLTNEKYIGNNVYNRKSYKLKKARVTNPPDKWIRSDGAFEAIVDRDLFNTARGIFLGRRQRISDEDMLDMLRKLHARHGRLSGVMIDEADSMPGSSSYRNRFGGLVRAYQLIDYTPETDYSYLETNRYLRELHKRTVGDVCSKIVELGGEVYEREDGLLTINNLFTMSIVIARCRLTAAKRMRWHLRFDSSLMPDVTVAVRMDENNEEPLDYYLLPTLDLRHMRMNENNLKMASDNEPIIETYRFDTLDYFFSLVERYRIGD